MADHAAPHVESGLLLLADISGYTSFLETVSEAHPDLATATPVPPAYELMISLLNVVTDALQPDFRPIETEGDAVFAVADADAVTNRGEETLATIAGTYAAFHASAEEQRRMQGHDCSACILITSLELKFVAHAGSFVVQQLPTRLSVAGPSVNLVHRLLKNRVTDATGLRGYLLLTDAALELLGLDPAAGLSHSEAYPHAKPVSGRVLGLSTAAG